MAEILAPAGNEECARAALHNGADAIYLGLNAFSARQSAGNFDENAYRAIVRDAHLCGAKVYVAMNTVVKDEELESFIRTLLFAWNEGADAIILQDPLLGRVIHARYPEIVLHLSTQAGVCNLHGAEFAKECGFSRVILARETPLAEIRKITRLIETEVFVQGALCTAFSGQCYFSSFAGGNSGNRGRCKQPCRKTYAYDRNGNVEKTYALSLSDLSVGESIEKLAEVGVSSFKIEGRMRRAEYVGAAVHYYRALLDGASENERKAADSDLRRAYNRGNYTKGLAFGQDKRFLSTAIQGHVGEKVGVVKVVGCKYRVESAWKPSEGDAFKILRDGKEVGGALLDGKDLRAFFLRSKQRLKNGDGVFVTTDNAMTKRVLSRTRTGTIRLTLRFIEGERPYAAAEGVEWTGDSPLQTAQNRALTKEELCACFLKTDGLPVVVEFADVCVKGNSFLPKSELNAFRRAFYERLCAEKTKGERKTYDYEPFSLPEYKGKNSKRAVISCDFVGISTDVAVYKPNDFTLPPKDAFCKGNFEKYVYYPPFATEEDERAIERLLALSGADGVYAENYAGLRFAKNLGVKAFAGTGLNIFNRLSLQELQTYGITYYAISKEANARECEGLVGENAFVLASGDVKLMDLCYCPFGKTCARCDRREQYTLTDENGRKFPVRRYLAADGSCRFEVYNCASLIGVGIRGAGSLIDVSVTKEKAAAVAAKNEEEQKQIYENYTSGHFKRGVL